MKNFPLLAVALFLPSLASATDSYTYVCQLLTNRNHETKIEVDSVSMKFLDEWDGTGSHEKGFVYFDNLGLKGGNGKMKDKLQFVWNPEKSEVSPGEVSEFFISPELTEGGFRLRNGSMGGFLTYAGGGYSYETEICILQE